MFSPDNLYNYLRLNYNWPKKNTLIRNMEPYGSMHITNLMSLPSIYDNTVLSNPPPIKYLGKCEVLDQEPINLNNLKFSLLSYKKYNNNNIVENHTKDSLLTSHYNIIPEVHPLYMWSTGIYTPIVAHSEQNSEDISDMTNNFYNEIHYWTHGFYALSWFAEYELLNKIPNNNKKRFGIYVRACDGTREYRIELLLKLSHISNNVYYNIQPTILNALLDSNNLDVINKWPRLTSDVHSNKSATIDWHDTAMFDIQIVAETLFDTSKTHLTEKVFKPIVMKQPFIIVGPPNSLKYMKQYGFKTFDSLWDESYDTILDSQQRLYKVINIINDINSMNKSQYNALITNANTIAEYNKNYFFSQQFKNSLINELHYNFDIGLQAQSHNLYEIPGGTLFHYYNLLYQRKKEIEDTDRLRFINIVNYIKESDKKLWNLIYKKYKNLLVRF